MHKVEFHISGYEIEDGHINTFVEDYEKAVQELLESRGFKTTNLSPAGNIFSREDIPDELVYHIHGEVLRKKKHRGKTILATKNDISRKGIPDILAWKETNGSAFLPIFIEVKAGSDVNTSQVNWLMDNDYVPRGIADVKKSE